MIVNDAILAPARLHMGYARGLEACLAAINGPAGSGVQDAVNRSRHGRVPVVGAERSPAVPHPALVDAVAGSSGSGAVVPRSAGDNAVVESSQWNDPRA